MRRRHTTGPMGAILSLLVSLPWPVLAVLGAVATWWVHGEFSGPLNHSPLQQALPWVQWAPALATGLIFGSLCVASFFKKKRRRDLLRKHSSLSAIRAMTWQDFERLVGEAYRRQGYAVKENGLGGADGGVDLILTRGRETFLVQCKRWRSQSIGVPIVREMWGLVHHHRASGAKVVTVGRFTAAAREFARKKEMDLVDGEALVELIASLDTPGSPPGPAVVPPVLSPTQDRPSPDCPRCGRSMVIRTAKRGRTQFWGCPGFPGCRGTRPIQGRV